MLTFDFEVINESEHIARTMESPEIGIYVYGLFIESACWDYNLRYLQDSAPKVLFNKMPFIWIQPIKATDLIIENVGL